MDSPEALIKADCVSYSYDGSSLALDSVSLTLRAATKYVLIGANGSGKTTLAYMLAGSLRPSSGTLIRHPLLMRSDGSVKVSLVQQHLSLYEGMTVRQNFAVVGSATGSLLLERSCSVEASRWLRMVGSDVHPQTVVGSLPFSERQLIEIARALYKQCPLIILDEPTAALDVKSRERLFSTLNAISAAGTSILLITHDSGEVARMGGTVYQLEAGRVVRPSVTHAQKHSRAPLCTHICGSWGSIAFSPGQTEEQVPIVKGMASVAVFDDAFLRSTVCLSLAGMDSSARMGAKVCVDDSLVSPLSPSSLRHRSIHLMPADRQRYGVFLSLTVADNLRLFMHNSHPICPPLSNTVVEALAEQFDIVMPSPYSPMATLSGGNQQKVLFAGLFNARPRCMVLEEPVLGMDDSSRTKALALLMDYLATGGSCVILTCFAAAYDSLPGEMRLFKEVGNHASTK